MDSHHTHSHLLGFHQSCLAVPGTHLAPSWTSRGSDQRPWTCLHIQFLPQPHNPPRSQAHPIHFLPPCHAPSWLDPGEPSHTHIHLTTDLDSTQLNASPRLGNVEYPPTLTSLTLTNTPWQPGVARVLH